MTTETPELAVVKQDSPLQLMRVATDVAGVSRDIVMKTAVTIQGRKYVRVEGWQAIALAHGCVAGSRDVEKIEGGYRAIGEVKRMSDGMILSTAEGFVGMDESKTWAVRPEYACRAMAQTRAISRACRSAFAHVVVLIDSNLSTTPAEEVPDDGFDNAKPIAAAPRPAPAQLERPAATPASKPPAHATAQDVTVTKDLILQGYKVINSKPDAPKSWTLHIGNFDDGAAEIEMSTFDAKLGDKMQNLKGEKVDVTYRAGRKANTWELVTIEPADGINF